MVTRHGAPAQAQARGGNNGGDGDEDDEDEQNMFLWANLLSYAPGAHGRVILGAAG